MITDAIFDVDGVFTDGTFHYDDAKKIYKIFGAHDSDAIKFLKFNGIKVQAITADKRGFEISQARMRDLNLQLTLIKETERLAFVSSEFKLNKTFFMGDGLHDATVLKAVAYGVCPANACDLAKMSANFVTTRRGGDGAILEATQWLSENKYVPKSFEDYLSA